MNPGSTKKPRKIIVNVQRSKGNERVGQMWIDSYLFHERETLQTVFDSIGDTKDCTLTIHVNQRKQTK